MLRFELLRRHAAASVELDNLPAAARDLKAALKLRPADPAVCHTLDDICRRAAAAGVELEPLPPSLPDDGVAVDEEDAAADALDAAEGEDEDGEGCETRTTAGKTSGKPPVGTRTAAQLKTDADTAFKEGWLGRAISLYGRALKADAAAEWMEGTVVGGLFFRCQCLANRSVRMRTWCSFV